MDQKLETSIKISNIQSLQEIKQEKEPIEESTIKIRTISEINQSPPPQSPKNNVLVSKQHPQQILSKHIVVRKVPNAPTNIKHPQMTRVIATNGSNIIKGPFPEPVVKPTINYTVPPVLEAYIKQLEDENKEMKKVLMECRKEAVAIQMRTHKLTNLINATVAKCNSKRPLSGLKQPIVAVSAPQLLISPQQSQQIQAQQHQMQSPPTQSGLMQRKQFKVLPRKGNNVTAKGNIVCRVPIFPISRLPIIKQLELDLSKKEFSEYVFQKLYNVNNKSDIDKPSILLNNTLNSIIDPKLMGQFQYEVPPDSNESSECEYFKSLQRVRVLYGKLVNSLSNTIFAKSVDMVALEKFVKNKISAHRNEYLATLERLKSTKMPVDNKVNSFEPTIKMEKLEPDDIKPIIENNFRWLSEDEDVPMYSEDG
ncbi:unnamed protein product [Chironomus riparius]|uniref:Uncharacterized protein n=1 Tax=Chironomus riparius TaxID=315576 RepID=A0A9N9WQW3_9DIPT|nr:unnamed protein product [Chironomus riparius]